MSRFAIRLPYLIIVICLITCVVGVSNVTAFGAQPTRSSGTRSMSSRRFTSFLQSAGLGL